MARKWQSGIGTWCSGSRPVFLTPPCCFFLPGGCGDLDGESEAGGVVGCLGHGVVSTEAGPALLHSLVWLLAKFWLF